MGNFNAVTTCINNAPAGATNALQYNAGSGAFGALGPLTNGQIPIGSTGSAPTAATITAGAGITVTNGPGSVTISALGGSSYTPPLMANFVWGHQPTGATAADTTTGLAMFVPSTVSWTNASMLWDSHAYPSSTPFSVVIGFRSIYLASPFTGLWGLAIGDGTGKFVTFTMNWSGNLITAIDYFNSYTSYNSNAYQTGSSTPPPFLFIKVTDDGTNFNFAIGNDINNLIPIASVARGAFIGTPTVIGLLIAGGSNSRNIGVTFFDYSRSDGAP